uniref:26S proteasome non-ATPase regulatory subunit 13 n=1 Tax=Magallana gigas TaxID=29159 RepID=A0A8W8MJE7_MAGGI
MPRDVGAYLTEQQRKSSGDVATDWGQIEELYNKKLWHQLTLKLLKFVKTPTFSKGDGLVKMYENFIADFEHRINPLALAEIMVYIVKQMTDIDTAVSFIEKMKEKVKVSDEAKALCLTTLGTIRLRNRDFPATKTVVEECSGLLNNLDGVTTVHGRFYELSSNYHKLMGNHALYYQEALRFLGCTNMNDMPASEQIERAFNLGLAAILGDGVYNFGELPDLASNELHMRQKISLLCLMEMTFQRPATNRQLTFHEIADETQLPNNEVEMLVMKALSLGLVKGSIDEIDQKVHMTWVQPRVLDLQQIATMQKRLEQWTEDVSGMEQLLEVKAKDILT